MRFTNLIPQPAKLCLILICLAATASSYFVIDTPSSTSKWGNGIPNSVTWTKGLEDGIDAIDIEMARLSDDGLIFVAKSMPATHNHDLWIQLEDIPAGDDYFLLFVNSTHGGMYATSNRFTVLPAGDSGITERTKPAPSATVVTVSGAPDPTKVFATTFAPSNGALSTYWVAGRQEAWSMLAVSVGSVLGAIWTLS